MSELKCRCFRVNGETVNYQCAFHNNPRLDFEELMEANGFNGEEGCGGDD